MSLAATTDPLRLADGRLVYPNGNIVDPSLKEEVLVEIPTNREATRLIVSARKKLADLPDVPKTMNTVGVVLSYSLFGLDDFEIALATGMTEGQVAMIKRHDAFTQMQANVIATILDSETASVRELFQQNSRAAVDKMLGILENSKSETNKLIVARDILDRAGHRPADVVEHRHKMEGGLTIEYIQREDKVMPVIDMEVDSLDDC